MLNVSQSYSAVVAGLLWSSALVGCAGPPMPVRLSVEDKQALDNALFRAELAVYGICPTTTTKFDVGAHQCAGILTVATSNIAAVHIIVTGRDATDTALDESASMVGKYENICDPENPAASIVGCLAAAETVKANGTIYIENLRAKLDAVK